MNKTILMGNLTKDPATTTGGMTYFSIAVNEFGKVQFFNCKAYKEQSDFITKHFTKGSKILITGRLENGSYNNKDGVTIPITSIVVERAEFCESKRPTEANPATDKDGFILAVDENELPFN